MDYLSQLRNFLGGTTNTIQQNIVKPVQTFGSNLLQSLNKPITAQGIGGTTPNFQPYQQAVQNVIQSAQPVANYIQQTPQRVMNVINTKPFISPFIAGNTWSQPLPKVVQQFAKGFTTPAAETPAISNSQDTLSPYSLGNFFGNDIVGGVGGVVNELPKAGKFALNLGQGAVNAAIGAGTMYVANKAAGNKTNPTDYALPAGLGFVVGALGGKETPTFTKEQLDLVRNGFTPEVRNLIGSFAQKVEESKSPNKVNLGALGDYAHSVAGSIFGEDKVANLTNTQLKNILDAVQQEAAKKPSTTQVNIGLATRDIRQGANSVPQKVLQKEGSTLQLKETPKLPLQEAGGLVQQPLESSLAQNTRQALNGQAVKERGFVTSVKQSENTPQAVKDLISGNYVVKSGNQLKKDALDLIRSDPQTAEQLAINPQNDTHIQIGNELINYYGSKGNFVKATQIADSMAQSGTEFGRAVQAFSNYDKTTPQGAIRFAQSKVNEYNKLNPNNKLTITDDQVKSIFDKAHAIQAMPEGRDRNIAANELMNTVNSLIPSGIADKAVTLWKAGLLTSLRTHERNLIGNTIHGVAEMAKDLPATIADKVLSLKTGQRTLTPTLKGVGSGLKTGIGQAKDIVLRGYDPTESISKYDVKKINWGNSPLGKAAKIYTESVFRTLGGEDKPFYNAAFGRSLYDQAGAAAINAGKSGDGVFIENLVKNPTPQMFAGAVKDAETATFHNNSKLGDVAKAVQNFKVGEIPVGQIVAPFTGVPSSIAGQVINYSPIGLLKGIANAGRVVFSSKEIPNLQRQAAQEIGRGVIGSGLIGIGAYLANKGMLTGQPKDPQEAAQWKLQGKPANSVLINGKWRSINSVGPENLILLAGGKLQQGVQNGDLSTAGANIGKDFLGQTFLQGVQGPLNAFSDPQRYAQSYIGNQTASIIPNIVKDTAKATDATARQSNTITDYLTNSLPLLRNQNLPQRDVLGNPVPQSPTGVNAFFDLFNSQTPISNPVVNELGRLNDVGNNATPSKLTKNQTINGVKMTLDPKQLDALNQASGGKVTKALGDLFQQSDYQALSNEEKANAVNNVVAQVRKQVRGTVDLSNPQAITGNTGTTTTTGNSGNQFTLINPDTGAVKKIDLSSPISIPTMTGNTALDKKLIAKYNSDLTTRANDIVSLYQNKKIDAARAGAELDKLANEKLGGTKTKKVNASSIRLKLPRLSLRKTKSFSSLKIKRPSIEQFSYKTTPISLKLK